MTQDLDLLLFGAVYHSLSFDELQHIKLAVVGVRGGRIEIFRALADSEKLSRTERIERERQHLSEQGWKAAEVELIGP